MDDTLQLFDRISMPKTLLEDMLKKPQRETAGSDTNLRFDYQKNWAFCEMIKRHLKGADYLVAFEYHDDVVFLETDENPEKIDFCQVKTKKTTSNITLGFYLSRKKGKTGEKPSILGKMYANFDGIGSAHEVKTILVSNAPFSFCTENSCASDLNEKHIETIKTKLTKELPQFDEKRLENIYFLTTGVSLDAMQSYLLGEVSELFKVELGEDHGVNIHAWTRLVQDEISRKNNINSETINSTEDLKSKKCVDRKFLSETIQLVSRNSACAPDMNLINTDLKEAGWKTNDLIKMGKQISNAVADYIDPTNVEAAELKKRLLHHFNYKQPETLADFLSSSSKEIIKLTNSLPLYSEKFYFLAFAVIVFHEEI